MPMTIRVYRRSGTGEEEELMPRQVITATELPGPYNPIALPPCACPKCHAASEAVST